MKKITLLTLVGSLLVAPGVFAKATESQKLVPLEYKAAAHKAKKVQSTSKKATKGAVTAKPAFNSACQVSVAPFADGRNNKLTLGASWAQPLLPNGLTQWLDDVRTLELINKTKSWQGEKQLQVKPRLLRLYSYNESMNIHGVIALSVEYWLDGKLVAEKKYRGMGSKANWANGLDEYATSLNYAVHEVVPTMMQDMKMLCSR